MAEEIFIKEYQGNLTRGDFGDVMEECFPIAWEGGEWTEVSVTEWEAVYGDVYGAVGVWDDVIGVMPIFV